MEKFSIKEAAEFLGVSKVKVADLIQEGLLTAEPNVLDRREKLIAREQLEEVKSRGRSTRDSSPNDN